MSVNNRRSSLRGRGVGSFFDFTGTLRRFGLNLKQLTTPRSFPTMTTLCFGLILMVVSRVRFFCETDCSHKGRFLLMDRSYTKAFELSPSVTAQITVDEYGAQSKSLTEAPSSKLNSGAEPFFVDQIFNVQSWINVS